MMLHSGSHLAAELLSSTRRVIPLHARAGDLWTTSIKLPDVVITNHSSDTMRLASISIHGIVNEQIVVSLFSSATDLKHVVHEGNELLNRLVGKKHGHWRTYNLRILFAAEPEQGIRFVEQLLLQPTECTCVRLCELIDFQVVHAAKITTIECCVEYIIGSNTHQATFELPTSTYVCAGDYTFPIQGSVMIEATPWNRILGHRIATSQEFAFDVVDCQRVGKGVLSLSSPVRSSNVNDYFIFNREVRAIGDGVVASCGDQWPEDIAENPLEYSPEMVTNRTMQLIEEGMDFAHAILGNYAIIDHENGEFSLYAHMREGSLKVRPGDRVTRGQAIGRVGNTSNSETPHLHFHLMDSADFVSANGLPVAFADLPTTMASFDGYDEPNPLLYSDYIFSYVG